MRTLIVLLVVGFLAATVLLTAAANGPAEIRLSTKMGDITFAHAQHQAKISTCTECHHKGTEAPKCTGCHGIDASAPAAKKAFHDQCRGCHRESGGPTKCKDCHVK